MKARVNYYRFKVRSIASAHVHTSFKFVDNYEHVLNLLIAHILVQHDIICTCGRGLINLKNVKEFCALCMVHVHVHESLEEFIKQPIPKFIGTTVVTC